MDTRIARRDMWWGIRWGLGFATFFSVVALAIYAVEGTRPFRANEVTIGVAISGYFLGGVIGGVVVGLLRPWTRSRIGAVVVGVIAGIFAIAGLAVALDGVAEMLKELPPVIILGVILGGLGGNHYWHRPPESEGGRAVPLIATHDAATC